MNHITDGSTPNEYIVLPVEEQYLCNPAPNEPTTVAQGDFVEQK